MRAHGTSEGTEFTPGLVTVSDFKFVIDELLKKTETNHIAIFGTGIGAAIAIQSVSIDGRCDALIAQSPFDDFSKYVEKYTKRKWSNMSFLLHVVLERALGRRLQYELTALNLSEIIKYVTVPSLFICGDLDDQSPPMETYAVYDSSGAREKNLIMVKKAGHTTIEQYGGEAYYNSIAQFIVNAIPKKQQETRFKKLVLND
jgi:cephalosporin-C deacetylase-like acetyl esterase